MKSRTMVLKIGHRVLIAILLPAVAFVCAALFILADKQAVVSEMQELAGVVTLATDASNLAHELQRERGISAVFLGSGGTQLAAELSEQRTRTDASREILDATLARSGAATGDGDLPQILREALQLVGQLAAKRDDISAQRISGADSGTYYTGTIGKLLDIGTEATKISSDVRIGAPLSAYVSIVQVKENAGQERAAAAAGFTAGSFSIAQQQAVVRAFTGQATFLRQFDRYASDADREVFARTMVGNAIDEVERMRKTALEAAPGTAIVGADGAHWFSMATTRIDLLKKVEDHLSGRLLQLAGDIENGARTSLWIAVVACVGVFAIALGLGILIARSITRPVTAMTAAMTELAGGNKAIEIPARGRKDEIGSMAQAVQVFKDNAIEMDRLQEEQKAAEKRAAEEKKRMMNELADSFQSSVGGIVETVSSSATEMQTTAQGLTATAEETSRQSTAVAAASEQASTNVQTVASAAEELSSSIAEISRQVASSAEIAGKAVGDAERTNMQVQGLAEAAQKIGEVVSLINDIASQTNLLALNATIEAARAGDAGKGFAVVASEVKNLANETAKATEEITGQITAVQQATREAVAAIQSIGGTISQINEIATTIASAVEEQGAATQEIARNVQQAAQGTQEVSSNIGGVTRAAGETGAAATQMLSASGELARQGEKLRLEVDRFLSEVRTA